MRTVPPALGLVAVAAATLLTAAPAAASTSGDERLSGVVDVVAVDAEVHAPGEAPEDDGPMRVITLVQTDRGLLTVPDTLAAGVRRGQRVTVTVRAPAPRATRTGATGTTTAATTLSPGDRPAVVAVAAEESPRLAQALRPALSGGHTLTILPVHWGAPDAQTPSSLAALAERAAGYWSRQSAGQIAVASSVRPWRQIAVPSGCDAGALMDAALAAHGLPAPTDARQHVAVYFPTTSLCGWAGLGTVGGSRIWINGYPLLDVLAHELGHNFGLGHANLLRCTQDGVRVPWSTSCNSQDYLDGADIMGYATGLDSGNLNTGLADALGLVRTVTVPAGGSAQVDLAPLADVTGVRAIKVDVGTGWVYVDYRPAVAPDVRRPDWAGVQVHYVPDGAYPQSYLLDQQPWLGSAFERTALAEHTVWRIAGSDVAVSVSATGATARVRAVSARSDVVPPTAPVVSARRGEQQDQVAVDWTAATDSGSGLVGYVVAVNGARVAHTSPARTGVVVPAGEGPVQVQVWAVDAAGNQSPGAVVALGGPGPDLTPPSAPAFTSPASGTAVRARTAVVTWAAATDAESEIVGYRLTADGESAVRVLPASARSATVSLAADRAGVVRLAAVNAAGLTGPQAFLRIVQDGRAPAVPRGLNRRPGTGFVTWAAAADAGSPVRFQVSLDNGPWLAATADRRSPTAARTGRHTWAVRAVDAAGNISGVARVTATVDVTPPSRPRLRIGAVTSRGSSRVATLSWSASRDAQSAVTGYTVVVQGASGTTTRTVGASVTRVKVALPPGAVRVSVRAQNAGGTPGPAATVSISATRRR